jgi:hypothetical protein
MAALPDNLQDYKPLARLLLLLQRIWRRVENFVFGIILFIILLYFVLQSTAVQNWLIQKVTAYLSDALQTKVEIRHINFELFDNLVLEGLYIQDLQGDTLLYAEKLSAGLNSNIFSLLSNKLEFDDLNLNKARFNIRRVAGNYDHSLQFLLDFLAGGPKKPKAKKSAFSVKIQNLRLTDIEVLKEDEVRGQRMFFKLPSGHIRVKNADLGAQIIDLKSVDLRGLWVDVEDRPSKPLPPRPGATPSVPDTTQKVRKPLQFLLGRFSLSDGRFDYDRFNQDPYVDQDDPDQVMNYNHLRIKDLDIQVENLKFDDNLIFNGQLLHLAATERCGIQLTHAESAQVSISDTLAALYGARLRTSGGTELGDTILLHYSTYKDFRKFNSKVRFDLRFAPGSKLRIDDVRRFNRKVAKNPFFVNNEATLADFSGIIEGKVNRLNGRNLDIRLGASTLMQGDFDGNDMNEGQDRLQIHFDFKKLQSDIATIGKIIPGFNPPPAFYRLGHIGYKGEYDILFGSDHILNGYLITDIGSGKLDMQMHLTDGPERGTYSGALNMNQFDLAAWTGSKDFGRTTFRLSIAEGSSGFTLPTVKARLSGVVDTFYYKGYRYKNVDMNGIFQERIFDGKLSVQDPNIDFTFDGTVNMRDSIPLLSFTSDIRRLDLGALNLLDKDWVLSGKIDKVNLNARDFNNLNGAALLRDFKLVQDKNIIHRIDSVYFKSNMDSRSNGSFTVASSVLDVDLTGQFKLTSAFKNLKLLFARYHPEIAGKLGVQRNDSLIISDQYTLKVNIKDTKSLTGLLTSSLRRLVNTQFEVSIDALAGKSVLTLNVPQIQYDTMLAKDIYVHWETDKETGTYEVKLPNILLSPKNRVPPVSLTGWLKRDEVGIKITARDTSVQQSYFVKGISLDGVLSVVDSLWQVRFNASEVAMFNEDWLISEDNYVRFGNGKFAAKDFEFFNENRRITVDSFNLGAGISVSFTNFDLDFLNRFVNKKKVNFRGKLYDFDVQIQDVFKLEGISGYITTDTVFINGLPYGDITGNIDMADPKSPVAWTMFLNYANQSMSLRGAFVPGREDPTEIFVPEINKSVKTGQFATHVVANGFPLKIIETFISGISGTSGAVDADIWLGGPFSKIAMRGGVMVKKGQVQLDYLKSVFHIKNQPIQLSETRIWAEGDTIYDRSERSMAFVKGGIIHDHFKKWQLACSIETRKGDEFMVLNTLPEDNPLYYGTGVGQFKADFSGSFSKTNILISAKTGRDTRLYIPLTGASDVKEVSFIRFMKKDTTGLAQNKGKGAKVKDLSGMNIEMNIEMTDEAEVQMIFDEQAGDVIKGRGTGNLKIVMNREQEFKMYGDYLIRRGEYLFTLLNWINKPFTVAEGGTISWLGDPYGAQIKLDATYEETTPLYNLIQDELQLTGGSASGSLLETDARKAHRTVVTMHLIGDLLKPNISFSLDFPNINSQLKTLVDNKMRLLRQDQNELNRQVFGLVVVGSFLPSNSNQFLQNADYVATAFNTLTQVLSNQFSNYLSGLAAEWFGGRVSSIDFDIAYNQYQNALDPTRQAVGRELQLRLTSGFANDRITVQVGSQFGLGQPGVATTDGFLGEDVVVEIQITENRQWKLKVYQRTEPDITLGQRRGRYGLGISFRKEFDSFGELMGGLGTYFRGGPKKLR